MTTAGVGLGCDNAASENDGLVTTKAGAALGMVRVDERGADAARNLLSIGVVAPCATCSLSV